MIGVTVDTRMVVVLGRQPGDVKIAGWVANAAQRKVRLLLLTLGYPVSGSQQALVESAIERAFDLRVPMDAVLVPGPAGLGDHLRRGDDVVVAATGREGRRIESMLSRRVPA